MSRVTSVALGVLGALIGLFAAIRKLISRTRTVDGAVLHTPTDDTGMNPRTGAVRSVQGADIIVTAQRLAGLWDPAHLERLARTYWTTVTRFSLGLCRVAYTADERFIYLVFKPLRLLTFQAPEYEMSGTRGLVRWRIERGLLVAKAGRGGDGYLEIEVCRFDYADWDKVRVHVEVEIANFYPALASFLGRWLYTQTQSRIHVIVCIVFLRRLVRGQLDRSPVGRFAGLQSAQPAPGPARPGAPAHAPRPGAQVP